MRSRSIASSCIALHHKAAPIRGWFRTMSVTVSRLIAARLGQPQAAAWIGCGSGTAIPRRDGEPSILPTETSLITPRKILSERASNLPEASFAERARKHRGDWWN
jgi:hypothetical protein